MVSILLYGTGALECWSRNFLNFLGFQSNIYFLLIYYYYYYYYCYYHHYHYYIHYYYYYYYSLDWRYGPCLLRIVFIMKKMILDVDSPYWWYYYNKPTVFALFTRIFFFFFFFNGRNAIFPIPVEKKIKPIRTSVFWFAFTFTKVIGRVETGYRLPPPTVSFVGVVVT